MKEIPELLKEHPFFEGLKQKHLALVSGCSKNVHFKPGEIVFRRGEPADRFYVIREGKVAVEIHSPDQQELVIQTIGRGEILGFSWLFPPYQWTFDARVIQTVRATAVEGECLRKKCEEDYELGYRFTMKFAQIAVKRLHATQIQLLDVYGHPKTTAAGSSRE